MLACLACILNISESRYFKKNHNSRAFQIFPKNMGACAYNFSFYREAPGVLCYFSCGFKIYKMENRWLLLHLLHLYQLRHFEQNSSLQAHQHRDLAPRLFLNLHFKCILRIYTEYYRIIRNHSISLSKSLSISNLSTSN